MTHKLLVMDGGTNLAMAAVATAAPRETHPTLKAIREWTGIVIWALFCLACGSAGVLAVFMR